MQHHRTRERTGKRARLSVSLLERIQPDAAGVDCGQNSHFVAVPPERDPQPVREFRTFTAELYQLADWLKQCQVKTVAMESTGVYWIPLFQILEARDFEVCLVNARHVKNVPGRRTDVSDCQWLQFLHSVGLLRASYRPEQEVCAIRSLLRESRVPFVHRSATGPQQRSRFYSSCCPRRSPQRHRNRSTEMMSWTCPCLQLWIDCQRTVRIGCWAYITTVSFPP